MHNGKNKIFLYLLILTFFTLSLHNIKSMDEVTLLSNKDSIEKDTLFDYCISSTEATQKKNNSVSTSMIKQPIVSLKFNADNNDKFFAILKDGSAVSLPQFHPNKKNLIFSKTIKYAVEYPAIPSPYPQNPRKNGNVFSIFSPDFKKYSIIRPLIRQSDITTVSLDDYQADVRTFPKRIDFVNYVGNALTAIYQSDQKGNHSMAWLNQTKDPVSMPTPVSTTASAKKILITGHEDGSIRLWDKLQNTPESKIVKTAKIKSNYNPIETITIRNNIMYAGNTNVYAIILPNKFTQSPTTIKLLRFKRPVKKILVDQYNFLLIVIMNDSTIRVYKMRPENHEKIIKINKKYCLHGEDISAAKLSPDGSMLYLATKDDTDNTKNNNLRVISLYNPADTRFLARYYTHKNSGLELNKLFKSNLYNKEISKKLRTNNWNPLLNAIKINNFGMVYNILRNFYHNLESDQYERYKENLTYTSLILDEQIKKNLIRCKLAYQAKNEQEALQIKKKIIQHSLIKSMIDTFYRIHENNMNIASFDLWVVTNALAYDIKTINFYNDINLKNALLNQLLNQLQQRNINKK